MSESVKRKIALSSYYGKYVQRGITSTAEQIKRREEVFKQIKEHTTKALKSGAEIG